jgi:hypothetical protein
MNIDTRESWPLLTSSPSGVTFADTLAQWASDGSYVLVEGRSSRTTWRYFEGVTYEAVKRLVGSQ